MTQLNCNTNPNSPTWSRHIAEIERLKKQAEKIKNSALTLSLAILLLEHKAEEWRLSEEKLQAGGER